MIFSSSRARAGSSQRELNALFMLNKSNLGSYDKGFQMLDDLLRAEKGYTLRPLKHPFHQGDQGSKTLRQGFREDVFLQGMRPAAIGQAHPYGRITPA